MWLVVWKREAELNLHLVHFLMEQQGMLLPSIRFVEKVDFGNARWLLVIEKEVSAFGLPVHVVTS